MAIVVNKPLPEFEANATGGIKVSNTSHLGQILVLYFYPKDNTPGCTNEACNLRDNYERFLAKGYAVVGVSIQDEKSHQRFIEKYALPFPLIADTDLKLVNALGVYGEKTNYGRTYMGTFRTTFIADEQGVVQQIFRPKQIKVKEHAEQILGSEA